MNGSATLGYVHKTIIFKACPYPSIQAVLFSHPGDFTPVCTTELGEVARRSKDFAARNTKVIGISANGLQDHNKWIQDINEFGAKVGPTDVQFPIVSCFFRYSESGPRTEMDAMVDRRPGQEDLYALRYVRRAGCHQPGC